MHNAKLIWVTPDAEALIGKIARVSNPNNEDNPEDQICYELTWNKDEYKVKLLDLRVDKEGQE